MSRVGDLLDEAHRLSGRAGFIHVLAVVRRRTTARELAVASALYRRAAEMLDEAARQLPASGGQQ